MFRLFGGNNNNQEQSTNANQESEREESLSDLVDALHRATQHSTNPETPYRIRQKIERLYGQNL